MGKLRPKRVEITGKLTVNHVQRSHSGGSLQGKVRRNGLSISSLV